MLTTNRFDPVVELSAGPTLPFHSSSPETPRVEGAGLPRRIRAPRAAGLLLGAVCVGAALLQNGAPAWQLVLMLAQVLAWPHLAYALSSRSPRPKEAEYRNLVLDCALSAMWLPAMGFNVLPSALTLAMVLMDTVAVGGPALLLRGALASALGVGLGCLLFPLQLQLTATLATTLACLPVLLAYPLTVGLVMFRLSTRLNDKRRQQERSERLVRHTFDAMEAGIVLYDADDRLLLSNQTFRQLHRPIEPLLQPGQPRAGVLRASLDQGLVREAQGREDAWLAEQLIRTAGPAQPQVREQADRSWRWLDQRLPDGSLLSFSTDVTDMVRRERELQRLNAERDEYAQQLREVNARLEQLSQTDALTGVANRRQFDQRLKEEWQRSRRHSLWLAVVMLDVDHFKRFNDHHGHLEGDACLRRVAQALQGCARRVSDVVARYGGEEFALLLPHTALEDAAVVAERCLAAVDAQAIEHGDSPLGPRVTVSVGVAAVQLAQASGDDPSVLLRLADEALYRAKDRGRHRVEA